MILHLTCPEKAALVSALCITHPEIKPIMSMDITLEMANETLLYPGIIHLLKLVCDGDTLIGLLTLIKARNKVNEVR